MTLIAVLHTPLCPLNSNGQTLHYHCDLVEVRDIGELHHHEALALIEVPSQSIPILDDQDQQLILTDAQWANRLASSDAQILRPGQILFLSQVRRCQRR